MVIGILPRKRRYLEPESTASTVGKASKTYSKKAHFTGSKKACNSATIIATVIRVPEKGLT